MLVNSMTVKQWEALILLGQRGSMPVRAKPTDDCPYPPRLWKALEDRGLVVKTTTRTEEGKDIRVAMTDLGRALVDARNSIASEADALVMEAGQIGRAVLNTDTLSRDESRLFVLEIVASALASFDEAEAEDAAA